MVLFAAVHMSLRGTLLPSQPRRARSAIGCRPAEICSLRGFRILTHLRHGLQSHVAHAREIGYIFRSGPLKRHMPRSSRRERAANVAIGGHHTLSKPSSC